jgi:hypothetical protein
MICFPTANLTDVPYWGDEVPGDRAGFVHRVESIDFWPTSYGQFPVSFPPHFVDSHEWVYVQPKMVQNKPCPNEGGFDGTLLKPAYAIIGVSTARLSHGSWVSTSLDPFVVDNPFQDHTRRLPRYPPSRNVRVMNDATSNGFALDVTGNSAGTCSSCNFKLETGPDRPPLREIAYEFMYLSPNIRHKICSPYAWSTGVFLRALTAAESVELETMWRAFQYNPN